VADPKTSEGTGVAVERARDPDGSEGAHGVRENAQACAHLAEVHRTLQHEHRNVQTLQGGRQRHAADARAHDDDPLRSHPSPPR
jgi:hypothetical protein